MSDNVISLEDYKKQKIKSIPSLKAFLPDHYYIYPGEGLMIHVLFLTDKSIFYDEEPVYVMEDQYGDLYAEPMEEETCEGWHELTKEAILYAIEHGIPPKDSA